jgi:Ca-activated chloride channel family protein
VFDSPATLLILLAILGGVSFFLLGRPRPPVKSRGPIPIKRRSPWLSRLPILLMILAVLFLTLSFTQFRFLQQRSAAGTVMLAIDVSDSMNRTDVAPSRFEAAVTAVRGFFDDLPGDLRVGLVTFAGDARLIVAPTADHSHVLGALDGLPRSTGTVIGDGLTVALDALSDLWEREGETSEAVVVLLSDGRDSGSDVAPEEAALRAGEAMVPVHTIVLGRVDPTEAGANEALLEGIAEASGGTAYTADSAEGLNGVYATLRSDISTELAISGSGSLFVGVAAVCAIVATMLLLVRLRSDA